MTALEIERSGSEGKKDYPIIQLEAEQMRLREENRSLREANEAIKASLKEYAFFYENSPIGYLTLDEKGCICDLNPAALAMTGCSREQLVHTAFSSLMVRGNVRLFSNHLNHCNVAQGGPVTTELQLQKRNGQLVPVQVVSLPFLKHGRRYYPTAIIDLTERKRNESAVEEAKEFAESIVETILEPLVILDADLKVVSVNRAFTEAFKKNKRAAKRQALEVVLNLWSDASKLRTELEKVLATDSTLAGYELELEPKGMGRRTFLVSAHCLDRKENLPPQLLVGLRDITEKNEADEKRIKSEAMLAEAQRLAHMGSWEWDIRQDKVVWSNELYRIFGVAPDTFEATYKAFLQCVHPQDRQRVNRVFEDAYKKRQPFEFYHRTNQGEGTRVLRCQGNFLSDETGRILKMIGTAQDVTELKKAEEQLRELNAELEKRVAARTHALQDSNQQMEAFCYSIAHDLRAPLRAMKGFSQILFEDLGSNAGDQEKEFLRRITVAADRMDQLINDLLDYGRLNTIELPIATIDAEEVVCEILRQFQSDQANDNSEIIRREALPRVRGHRVALAVALTNIISNGIKFVSPGVKPRIEIWPEHKGKTVRIWIQDNGIGIAPEHQQKIFEVFERLHSNEDYPGTGIGLAIVAKGIKRIGGSVGVESQVGHGSRFWIELPVAGAL